MSKKDCGERDRIARPERWRHKPYRKQILLQSGHICGITSVIESIGSLVICRFNEDSLKGVSREDKYQEEGFGLIAAIDQALTQNTSNILADSCDEPGTADTLGSVMDASSLVQDTTKPIQSASICINFLKFAEELSREQARRQLSPEQARRELYKSMPLRPSCLKAQVRQAWPERPRTAFSPAVFRNALMELKFYVKHVLLNNHIRNTIGSLIQMEPLMSSPHNIKTSLEVIRKYRGIGGHGDSCCDMEKFFKAVYEVWNYLEKCLQDFCSADTLNKVKTEIDVKVYHYYCANSLDERLKHSQAALKQAKSFVKKWLPLTTNESIQGQGQVCVTQPPTGSELTSGKDCGGTGIAIALGQKSRQPVQESATHSNSGSSDQLERAQSDQPDSSEILRMIESSLASIVYIDIPEEVQRLMGPIGEIASFIAEQSGSDVEHLETRSRVVRFASPVAEVVEGSIDESASFIAEQSGSDVEHLETLPRVDGQAVEVCNEDDKKEQEKIAKLEGDKGKLHTNLAKKRKQVEKTKIKLRNEEEAVAALEQKILNVNKELEQQRQL